MQPKPLTNLPAPGALIAVWFSCGAASAVAAKKTVELYGDSCDVRIINNPVIEEDADNRRFMFDVQQWLGVPIEVYGNPAWPDNSADIVWEKRKFMSGPKGAPCTDNLKKLARQHWENAYKPDWHVMGFTADEEKRSRRFMLGERPNTLPVLIEAGITKADCFAILKAAGIKRPRMYDLGYPNANCIGCVKATSPTYWNHVRAVHPEVFKERAERSRTVGRNGAKLVRYKGKRIFLDELPPDAQGKPMKALKTVECGIFCEEKPRHEGREAQRTGQKE